MDKRTQHSGHGDDVSPNGGGDAEDGLKGGSMNQVPFILILLGALAVMVIMALALEGERPGRQAILEAWLSESGRVQQLDRFGVKRLVVPACPQRLDECSAQITLVDDTKVEVMTSRLPVGFRSMEISACDDSCEGYEVRASVIPERVSLPEAESAMGLTVAFAMANMALQRGRAASWGMGPFDQ